MARTRLGSLRLLPLAGLLLAAAGCDDEPVADRQQMADRIDDVVPMITPDEPAPLPGDRAAMLRALAPLPSESLLVVYEIEGPGGIGGTLEVLARPGGYRRENWTIQVPLGQEQERRLAGSIIQTPDGVWIEGTEPSTLTPSPLGALADAALALDEPTRRAVVEQLQVRRDTLAQARAQMADEDQDEQILDVPCHSTRVATIEMCVWEETGLPLRYGSDALTVRAVNIDADASIGEHAFDLPFDVEASGPPDFDARDALERLAQGDLAGLSPYLHPGLRLPTAV